MDLSPALFYYRYQEIICSTNWLRAFNYFPYDDEGTVVNQIGGLLFWNANAKLVWGKKVTEFEYFHHRFY